jgi:hypothetical protein
MNPSLQDGVAQRRAGACRLDEDPGNLGPQRRLKKRGTAEVTGGTTVVEAMPGLCQKQSYKQGAIRFDPLLKDRAR